MAEVLAAAVFVGKLAPLMAANPGVAVLAVGTIFAVGGVTYLVTRAGAERIQLPECHYIHTTERDGSVSWYNTCGDRRVMHLQAPPGFY
jgi:hypothetical protein